MEGEPARAGLGLDEPVRDSRRQQQPVARAQFEPLAADLEHGAAGEHDDPLVLSLQVVGGSVEAAAEDLLDDRVLEGDDLLGQLAENGRLGGFAERAAPVPGHRPTVVHRRRVVASQPKVRVGSTRVRLDTRGRLTEPWTGAFHSLRPRRPCGRRRRRKDSPCATAVAWMLCGAAAAPSAGRAPRGRSSQRIRGPKRRRAAVTTPRRARGRSSGRVRDRPDGRGRLSRPASRPGR